MYFLIDTTPLLIISSFVNLSIVYLSFVYCGFLAFIIQSNTSEYFLINYQSSCTESSELTTLLFFKMLYSDMKKNYIQLIKYFLPLGFIVALTFGQSERVHIITGSIGQAIFPLTCFCLIGFLIRL